MRYIIEENSSEIITVITNKDNLSIKQEFKGHLPEEMLPYKIIVLNKQEVRRLKPILDRWLNGGLGH